MISEAFSAKAIPVRFGVSLIANALRAMIGFITAMLLARWLGPSEYGRVVFLVASHLAIQQFFDMGTSSAFFTFVSERVRSRYFIFIFWLWTLLQFLILFSLVTVILPDGVIDKIWNGEGRGLVTLAMVSGFLQGTVWRNAAQMGEAQRETNSVQLAGVLTITAHLLILTMAWIAGRLTIDLIFILLALEWGAASYFVFKLYKPQDPAPGSDVSKPEKFTTLFKEYKHYCLPLIPLAWLGAAHDFLDRWMLQAWSGSEQQAYFGVAAQISSVSLLFTMAVLRILWKEVAEINESHDYEAMKDLYQTVTKRLYFLGAFLSAAMLPWASEILTATAGNAYIEGLTTFSLMLLYPVHQCLGQVTNTMFYATRNTRLMMIVNSFFLTIGVGVTYLLLSPSTAVISNFQSGSTGLALKLILMQLIFVNISIWTLSKKLKWPFEWRYQVWALLTCFTASQVSYALVTLSCLDEILLAVKIVLFLIIYIPFLLLLLYKNPSLIGLSEEALARLLKSRVPN